MDVIFKEGLLYLQGVKFGKRTWRKIWLMLIKPSSTGVGRLELYTVLDNNTIRSQKKAGRQKAPDRKVVRLSDCFSVTLAPEESCPQGCTAFYLNTTQCTYTLASTTSQDWLSALCLIAFQKDPEESDKGCLERGSGLTMENNDLYSSWKTDPTLPPNQYQVSVQSTEASRRCKLAGKYLVSPEKEAVILLACNTGHIVYCWPYRLLRKFGHVEGGFSIEAGRRCQSGKGVFIFLSTYGTEIFRAISEQCSVERSTSVQPLGIDGSSPCEHVSPVILPTSANQPAGAPEDDYSTISDASALNLKQLSFGELYLSSSKEAVGDEGEHEDEQCHSLESLSLDGDVGNCIYYNLKKSTPPLTRRDQLKPEIDQSECTCANVKNAESPSHSQFQPVSSPFHQRVPQLSPCTLPRSPLDPKPRYQRQPGFSTLAHAVDGMKEMEEEEAISSSTHVTPTEAPSSFKQKLAGILSKELAKFQPRLPPKVGDGPTFSQ
ncbi:putative docking protein 3 [Scophthalmus maximus]|uniref:Putative docking protein 3 n=1 Tax=Scophthalmus maximus TaxID=52904 RepID=A0A2U9CBL1_SCOMX|nr:putative docking protein 3 [Scophthalmus maximus]